MLSKGCVFLEKTTGRCGEWCVACVEMWELGGMLSKISFVNLNLSY